MRKSKSARRRGPRRADRPRTRTVCSARRNCDAKHAGAFVGKFCVVCDAVTFELQTVAAWDVPCCMKHNLHADYRVSVIHGVNRSTRFVAERRIEIAS